MSISQGAPAKENRFRLGYILRFIRGLHCLNCFSTSRQGLVHSSEAEHQECGSGVN